MLIKREILEKIKTGEITLQFRRWSRASVKPGGTLKTAVGMLNIGAITNLERDDVAASDLQRAGFANKAEFDVWLESMKPGYLCKIELSYGGPDPLIALRENRQLSAEDLAATIAKLDAMDKRGANGDWTQTYLNLIATNPAVLAAEMAAKQNVEPKKFKADISKLKALGLTESLETGYRLSPRGETILKART